MGRQRSLSDGRSYLMGRRATRSLEPPAGKEPHMPTVMRSPHPSFRVHDRHPALHGLAWLVLCLVVLLAFLATVVPGAPGLAPSPDGAGQAASYLE